MNFGGKDYKIAVWDKDVSMPKSGVLVLDTETTLIEGASVPSLVTTQLYFGTDTVYYIRQDDLAPFFKLVKDNVLVFHNAPFDIEVLCKALDDKNLFHDHIDNSRLHDTQIMWKLFHLATVGYVPHKSSLAFLIEKFFQIELEKDTDIRCNFEQFLGKDIHQIPGEFLEYGAKDVVATYELHKTLAMRVATISNKGMLTLPIQVAGAVALNRIYLRGIGFDLDKKEVLEERLNGRLERIGDKLATYGWARGIPGSNDAYENIVRYLGLNLPTTESGMVSSKEEDLAPYKDKSDFIKNYLDYHSIEKTISFTKNIKTERVHPRYSLLKNTGRTSCTGSKQGACNIQQLPRDGEVRSLFIPKDGCKFIITDYTAIELSALAQVTYSLYGFSKMRELINEGRDLHKYAASRIYNINEDEVDKSQRLLAKILNFGLGANMSHITFVEYAKQFGVELTEDESFKLKNSWVKIFPEMKKYWNLGGEFGATYTHTTLTGRVRNNCSYTAYLNTSFQGLAADGAKLALYYLDHKKVDIVAFVHDEIVSEVPTHLVEEKLALQEDIMIRAMRQVIPDVEVRVESQVEDKYCK